MKKNVIITRSYDENLILAEKIRGLGLNPILSPMLSHDSVSCDFTQFQDYTDVIITSKFAAHIISRNYPYNIDAWVVGEESAELLSHNDKINVRANYDSVSELIQALQDKKKKFLYLSGDNISQEILFAERRVIYKTEYAQILSDETLEIIKENKADFLMFYSKNSAVNFIDLVKSYKSLQNLQNSVVIAISKEVGSVLKAYVKDVFFPARPNANKMLELLCAKNL